MNPRLRILGCGSSAGVPRVAQGWGVCDPSNSKNRRRRCSILVERDGPDGVTRVLVDTSPDLREQLIGAGVSEFDAILWTHAHADHIHGIDDVRPLVHHMGRRLDGWMDEPTSAVVRNAFGYIFESAPGSLYPPLLTEHRLRAGTRCKIHGAGGAIEAWPILLDHGEIEALGFRFGDVAYSPDLVKIPRGSLEAFERLDLWVIDGLRYTTHPTHLCIDEALDLIRLMRPKRAVITNMSSEVDYETLRRELPPNVEPAFDGMVLEA
jgi:phosphoribosyl 1,2-cyclic phosphate phosphodiesterase